MLGILIVVSILLCNGRTPWRNFLQVLKSSNELVEAIKSELKDCVLRVSRGRTLLELGGVFQVSHARGTSPATGGGGDATWCRPAHKDLIGLWVWFFGHLGLEGIMQI